MPNGRKDNNHNHPDLAIALAKMQTWLEVHEDLEKAQADSLEKGLMGEIKQVRMSLKNVESNSKSWTKSLKKEIDNLHVQRKQDLEGLNVKMDAIITKQTGLLEFKNKWGGVVLAMSMVGAVILAMAGNLLEVVKEFFHRP